MSVNFNNQSLQTQNILIEAGTCTENLETGSAEARTFPSIPPIVRLIASGVFLVGMLRFSIPRAAAIYGYPFTPVTENHQAQSKCSRVKTEAKIMAKCALVFGGLLAFSMIPVFFPRWGQTAVGFITLNQGRIWNVLQRRVTAGILAQLAVAGTAAYFLGPGVQAGLEGVRVNVEGVRNYIRIACDGMRNATSRKERLILVIGSIAMGAFAYYSISISKWLHTNSWLEMSLPRLPNWENCTETITKVIEPIQATQTAIPTSYALGLATQTYKGAFQLLSGVSYCVLNNRGV